MLVFWWVNLIKVPAYIEVEDAEPQPRHPDPRPGADRGRRGVSSGSGRTGGWRTPFFFRLTYGLLAVTGAKLVYDALI